ncbi:hypothetical protein GCM10009801_02420 [Streptomyces albiaxialis]|uniref:DUF5709 domain-containing protein n=1 Tax=Streptomyces albiaxialis TaxID=329523 RepID=A0ABP5H5N1_9ACTN
MRGQCRDRDAHADTEGRQDGRRGDGRADVTPLRTQATLGEDDHERGVSENLGQLRVAEAEPDAVLPYGDAYTQIDEKAGQAGARGQPDGGDGDEQDERAE